MVQPKKSTEIPVTQKMLSESTAELKSNMTSMELRLDAKYERLESKLETFKLEMKSDLQKIMAGLHKVTALVEEQNSRNLYVLDGYQSLYDRQDRLEAEVKDIKDYLKL